MAWTQQNMPSFTPDIEGAPTEGLWTPTSTQQHRLGARFSDGHGRVYRYVKNGAAELAAGYMCSSEAPHADVSTITQTGYTTAIGDEKIRCLFTTTNNILDDELVDGFLTVATGTGLGHTYGIAGNKYISGDTVSVIDLYEPIRVATAATSVMSFAKSRHRDVIVCATTPAGSLVGVAPHVITASYYGWLQVKGPCGVVVDTSESILIGCEVGTPASGAVAGACGVAAITEGIWGKCLGVEAAAGTALIDLALE